MKIGDIIQVYSIKGDLKIEDIDNNYLYCKSLDSGVEYVIFKDKKLIK